MQNVIHFNERQFYKQQDAFELTDGQFVKLFRLKKETADLLIDIVETNSRGGLRVSAIDSSTQVSKYHVQY